MTARLNAILRHPVKSIGLEEIESAPLTKGRAIPFDREWAILTDAAKVEPSPDGTCDWAKKINFVIGRSAPGLMSVTSKTDEATRSVTLMHPLRAPVTISPDSVGQQLIDWLGDLWPATAPSPSAVVKAGDRPLTDEPVAYISLLSTSTLDDLSRKVGSPLSRRRFRANLWVDGWEPLFETGLIGRHLKIGTATLKVEMPIERCRATDTNPDTGLRDIDMLKALEAQYGTRDLGIFCTVVAAGTIRKGDTVEVI